MTIERARALSVLIALGLVFSTACGSSPANESTVYIDVQRIPTELRDEYASFATNCSKCHNLSRALNAPVTDPKHWDLYVARMMRTAGSAISAKEAPVILRFLKWYTVEYKKANSLSGGDSEPAPSTPAAPEPFPMQATPMYEQPPPQEPSGEITPPATEQTPGSTQSTAGEDK